VSAGPVALFGPGGEPLRAAALALAEAGRPIGLATLASLQQQEFATASIANELWVLGADHLHRVIDAAEPAAAEAFLAELEDRFGPLAACLIDPGPLPAIAFDEWSLDEWLPLTRRQLAAVLAAARAAIPLLERRGGGAVLIARHPAPAGASAAVVDAALAALPGALAAEYAGRPLRFAAAGASGLPADLLAALA
jgi:NADP-dependent 3-hydroxy acid dehydrogenase YdfG